MSTFPLKGAPVRNQKITPLGFNLGSPGLTFRAWVAPKQLHPGKSYPGVDNNVSMAAPIGILLEYNYPEICTLCHFHMLLGQNGSQQPGRCRRGSWNPS